MDPDESVTAVGKKRSSRQTIRHSLHGLLALVLGLGTFIAVVAFSAHTARVRVVAKETPAFAGPVCFFQEGYPTCVERPGPSAVTAPETVVPEDLLKALLAGPTISERVDAVKSALPRGTRLISVQSDGLSITVRLAFPAGYLTADLAKHNIESFAPPTAHQQLITLDHLAAEAIQDQIVRTLFPLGYRGFFIEAEDPDAPGSFRPVSAFLPPLSLPTKGGQASLSSRAPETFSPTSQPPVEVQGRPQGALSGKTVYVSAGHGWQWNGYSWRTQRPPYPDASLGYYGPIIEDHNNAEVVNQYLLRYLWNAGADVWTARERDLNPFEHIGDDAAAGFVTSGNWEVVNGTGYSGRHLRATTDPAGTASATWTSNPVPSDGVYALYVWYGADPDRTSDARYTVHHAGGATELTVDQRHHGHTWRYVGRFPARAGEALIVSLSNHSAAPGQVVVADAIRIGGGWFDDADLASNGGPVETDAPTGPNKPWWETAAYYNVQRFGIDPGEFTYFNDVVARPLWARWEHFNTGEDAVFVSWHTNGYNGHNTTRWGTVSFINSYNNVPGDAALRDAIHSELINDARAGWDPNWRDLGTARKDLGELRELYDSDLNNAIPGALIEIAYHDHAGDTDALKDPRFALLSARAVYQGIVKYFGSHLPLLPEPPTHLTVRNDGPGQIHASWRPSPTDGVGLVGDAAESYRIYTSRDGLGWDNGQTVFGTQTTITGLDDGELVFVRVTAVNAGGESFPTPVLAARSSAAGAAKILIVDGFDRIDRHGLIIEDDSVEGINARLFPDQINSYDYVIQHGENITYPFDSAVNEAVADGDLNLASYTIVDWILGEESTVDRTFDADEQAIIAAYLDGEGALFVSGAEIGWDLVTQENGVAFFQTYLGADMNGDDGGTYQVTPTGEGIFAGLGAVAFDEGYDADYPDQVVPINGSISALHYLGGSGGVAAVQHDGGGCRRVVYLGFPFETIAAAQRPTVMARVMEYLGADACLVTAPQTVITTPVAGAAFNVVPDFGGTTTSANDVERVEVRISDPYGRYWDGQDWSATSLWLTALGSETWHFPLPPAVLTGTPVITTLDEGQYNLWARTWVAGAISDTTPAFASFIYDTISPATPTLLSPRNGITVDLVLSGFSWFGSLDDTGSALAYQLQIDSKALTQALTYYNMPFGLLANGVHTWRVRAVDAAGNRSPWTKPWFFVVDKFDFYFPLFLVN